MKIIIFMLALWSVMPLPVSADIQQLNSFNTESYQILLDAKNNQNFLLVLWSLDCSPCMQELDTLAKIARQYADIKLIFVSTDSSAETEEIMQLMRSHDLDRFQQWVYSKESVQSLRYSIDPAWYGELPRAYLHSQNAQRDAVSGRLTARKIESWYTAINSLRSEK